MTDTWWNICLECMEMKAESRPQISHVVERIGEMPNEE
ncbi:hypothetical protein ID866_11232 [Astraeus odoratus]|nr:hypothetical protein ID866_11232 [Astraeus odoratus]